MGVVGAAGGPLADIGASASGRRWPRPTPSRSSSAATTVGGPSPGLPCTPPPRANLVEPATGKLSGVSGNSPNGDATETLPMFNALANVLARCTAAAPGPRAAGSSLWPGPVRGAAPRDTLDAILDIATLPGRNGPPASSRLQRPGRYGPDADVERRRRGRSRSCTRTAASTPPGRMAFDAAGERLGRATTSSRRGRRPGRASTVAEPTGRPILGSPLSGGEHRGCRLRDGDRPGRDASGSATSSGNSVSLLDAQRQGARRRPAGYDDANGRTSKPQGLAVDRQRRASGSANFAGTGGTSSDHDLPPRRSRRAPDGDRRRASAMPVRHRDRLGRERLGHQRLDVAHGPDADSVGHAVAPDGAAAPRPRGSAPAGSLGRQGIAVDSADNLWVASLASQRSVTRISNRGRGSRRTTPCAGRRRPVGRAGGRRGSASGPPGFVAPEPHRAVRPRGESAARPGRATGAARSRRSGPGSSAARCST